MHSRAEAINPLRQICLVVFFILSSSSSGLANEAVKVQPASKGAKTILMQDDCPGEQNQLGVQLFRPRSPNLPADCNGVRGGAAGTPFVDLIYDDSGKGFYGQGDINGPRGKWERALMQAIWQLSFMQCSSPAPEHPVSIGKNVFDGYWSKTGLDTGGKNWPVEQDPLWKSHPVNAGSTLWIPAEPYLYCSGDFKAKLSLSRSGRVSVNLLSSTFPPTYARCLEQSLVGLSGHPAVSMPPEYSGDSIDLTFKLNVGRNAGPLMVSDAKPLR